jgi:NADP-dependent 3-hydroxy acid dehydrogenase YdfG
MLASCCYQPENRRGRPVDRAIGRPARAPAARTRFAVPAVIGSIALTLGITGDSEGGQRVISQFALRYQEQRWMVAAGRHAGVMLLGPALDAPVDEWDRMVALNVRGMLFVTHAALPHLVRAAADAPRRAADVVTITSTAGRVARPGSGVYSLTKFGAAAFSEAVREMISRRVRVSVIEPGTVDTELTTHLREDIRQAAQSQTDAIDPPRPEDIADTVSYIVTRDRRVAVNEILVRAAEQTR